MSISMEYTELTTLLIMCIGLLSQTVSTQRLGTTTTKSPPGPPLPIRTTTAATATPGCEDKSGNCRYWAGIGECTANPNYMLINCKLSCDVCEESFDIRLVDGPTPAEGRLEVQYKGQWGTVCDDGFEMPEATVACQQLGFDLALEVRNGAYYGWGNGNILLDDLNCQGDEKMLSQCITKDWGSHDCSSSEDAGVQCGNFSEPFEIRLVDGPTSSEGRLEVHHQGIWGTVCDDGFESIDADVVCRQLGYDYALEVKDAAFYGQGDGIILLDQINCQGNETLLSHCRLMAWGSHNCEHYEDVGVKCGSTEAGVLPIRLSESSSPNRGNIQVFYKGNWGYICASYGWHNSEADVACRQLGYENGGRPYDYYVDFTFGNTFVISTITCDGDEDNLGECSVKGVDSKTSTITQHPWYDYPSGQCWSEASVTCKTEASGGLSGGKIAGITVTCFLVVIMLVVIPLVVFRCKKPKTDTGTMSNGTAISGEPIQGGGTTVMYMNSHTGAPQMMMPYGSPAMAYGQNGQIIYQQQPAIVQQPFNSQQQTGFSQTGYPNGAQGAPVTGLSADIKQIPPQENQGGNTS